MVYRGLVVASALFLWAAVAQAEGASLGGVDLSTRVGVSANVVNAEAVTFERIDGRKLGKLAVSEDPYTENAWEIRLPDLLAHAGKPVVVEVYFHDAGAGVLSASLQWDSTVVAASRQRSYTRCNTGTERFAAFAFALPATAPRLAPVLRIAGLQYPLSVDVKPAQEEDYWEALKATLPKQVRPLVALKNPMRLVTTTGIDVTGGFESLDNSLEQIAELAPLTKALVMTSIEGYVTWKRLEPEREGEFDFSFYDAIVHKLAEYDLKFFPLLIVGSGYALPEWFIQSEENEGFVCLEHGLENAVQSIWYAPHRRHVERVLKAFGDHYGPMGVLEAVRLGPSGNYGESQYPAGGNWGPKGEAMHIHIGWWAGDAHGRADYRRYLVEKYATIDALNAAWESTLASFDEADCRLPELMLSRRERADFTQWYTDSMSDWCAWWGGVTRDALPNTPIYQSAGGWGFREAGTDYSEQTRAMKDIHAGIRLTNETDSFEQNVYATRLAATAARLHGVPLGYEPASSHTARGVAGRIFNTLTTNGDHLFTYQGNLINSQLGIEKWIDYTPLFDTRRTPLMDVAVYYPETENQLGDAAFRSIYAWGFNPRAAAVRRVVDVDYLDDNLIRQGYLDQFKVLVCVWGDTVEADVQEKMDAWVRAGGTLVYHNYPRGPMRSVEGESKHFAQWSNGDTGAGKFIRYRGDMEPPSLFTDFLRDTLPTVPSLHPWTKALITADRPDQVFLSLQDDGHVLALNYNEKPVTVTLGDDTRMEVPGYGIARVKLAR